MKESVIPLGEIWIAARLAALAMTERQFTAHPVTFATTNRLVILNAQRERIRISLKRERIATRLTVLAMTGKRRYNRASYFYATAKCLVIPRERVSGGDLCKATVEIRLPFCKRTDCRAPFGARNDEGCGTDCHTPFGGLACRLGRCFCSAEVSIGHPHHND